MVSAQQTRSGWRTISGRRASNQDAVLAETLPDGRELIAVADGMGGHMAGEVASQHALETMRARLQAGSPLPEAVAAANDAVYAAARDNPAWRGMGTTVVALLRNGDVYQIANVGDSRAYRVSAAGLQQITADHSFIAEAVSQGALSTEEAQRSRWRNALTRAVGTEAQLEVDLFGPFDATDAHSVVLCSDGLYASISEETLRQCVVEAADPHAAAARLTEEAYSNGSSDNISVAIVTFGNGRSAQANGAATGQTTVVRQWQSPSRRPSTLLMHPDADAATRWPVLLVPSRKHGQRSIVRTVVKFVSGIIVLLLAVMIVLLTTR